MAFAKIIENTVEYILHVDVCNNVPNHPGFHLQFESNRHLHFPRVDMQRIVSITEFVDMIIRDKAK